MSVKSYSFFQERAYKWTQTLSMGVFLYLFLIAFLPFGVSNYNPNHEYTGSFLLEISIFGLITLLASVWNEFFLKRLLPQPIRLPHIIGWSLWTTLSVGVVLFITYNYLGNWHDWTFKSGIKFVLEVSMVFIFPIAGTFIYFNYQSLKSKYDAILTSESEVDTRQLIKLTGQGTHDQLAVAADDFLYARAQDNYVELHFLRNGTNQSELFREKLSGLLAQVDDDFIIRCHRSYLVNLLAVTSIKGRSSDLKLFLKNTDQPLPVSKTYLEDTMAGLKRHKHFH